MAVITTTPPVLPVRGIGLALQGVLLAGVLVAVVNIVFEVWAFDIIGDSMVAPDPGRLRLHDSLNLALGVSMLLGIVAGAVVWPIWQYRLASSTPSIALRRSPAMHVGSWFIPFVALWFPLQNVSDLWRHFIGGGRNLLGWWWASWIVATFADRVVPSMARNPDSLSDYRDLAVAGGVSSALWIVASIRALHVVRRLTRAAEGRASA